MKYLYSFLFITLLFAGTLHAQSHKWIRGGGTNQSLATAYRVEASYRMCTDYNGNVYSLSIVGNNAIYADTFYRSGAFGSSQNILFTSHNCNGQMRFAKLLSSSSTYPIGISADNSGHIYVAVDLPHYSTSSLTTMRLGYDTTVTTMTNCRMTIIQYDTVGHLNWFRFVGADAPGTYTKTGGIYNYLAMDGANRPHLACITGNGVSLSPTVTSTFGYYDLTYDVSGSLLSVDRLQVDTTLWISGMTIDKQSGKKYIYGKRDYGTYPALSKYTYISALNPSGNRIWIDTLSNPFSPTYSTTVTSIGADNIGHIYVTVAAGMGFAYRGDTIQNSMGLNTVTTMMKVDTSGDPMWQRVFNASVAGSAYGITFMPNNKIATGGQVTGMIVAGTDTLVSYSGEGQNAFLAIVDSGGYVHALQQFHGIGFYDYINTIASDRVGNLYIGGKVENNIWAGSLSPYTSVGGDSDYFISKYGVDCSCTAMPVANYTYTGTELTRSFTYTGTMSGIDSVRWNFGDGVTSTSMSPVHTYTGAGTFTTCVRVYSSCGNDMRCHEVTVACAVAVTSAFTDTGVLAHGFKYTGTLAGYDSVVWDFGDGNTDAGLTKVHTYAVADTYHVCAKVYTNCGTHTFCKDLFLGVPGLVSAVPFADVSVFPNPATEELYVSGVSQHGNYRLISVVGATIQSGTLHAGTNVLQTQQIPPGIYVLEMSAQDGQKKVVRIIKQ